MFHQESYNRHQQWYNQYFPTENSKSAYYKNTKLRSGNNVSGWLQNIFFKCLDPLLAVTGRQWLTVGDAYGFDAQYILSKGSNALASDLNTDLLSVANKEGIINDFAAENAEKLSYNDNSFDYVLCKESYHHFPRPYAALYEMIRVTKKAIVIIEPQDPVSKMPLLLLATNLLAKRVKLLDKIWKNRFSYEPVGNFVYKISSREIEKFAAGLSLPLVAFKKINPNFYFKGAEDVGVDDKSLKFLSIKIKKSLLDLLTKLGIFPGQVLSAIIYKTIPDELTLNQLKKSGYHVVRIPQNPYL